jgi:rSAM/selenodomain-associated transferase 1
MVAALSKTCLQIFTRAPIAGFCKTRLAKDIGSEKALLIHKKMLDILLSNISMLDNSVQIQLWCKPDINHSFFTGIHNKYQVELYEQHGDSLGDILDNAAICAFNSGFKNNIQIGSDSPDIDCLYIETAINVLHTHDIAVGPASDGGYVLFSQKKYHPGIYSGINWGTPSVLKQLTNNLKESGLTISQLNTLTDIDTIDDLQKNESLMRYYQRQ